MNINTKIEMQHATNGTNSHHANPLHRLIRVAGIVLFLRGLAVFTFSVFIGNYSVTDAALGRAAEKVPQDVLDKMAPLNGNVYASRGAALDDILPRINPEGTVQAYQLGEYKFWLLKAIAGDEKNYHETDDAGGLAVVFQRIAVQLGCVPRARWP